MSDKAAAVVTGETEERTGGVKGKRRLRWRYLVDRRLQFRYIGFLVGVEALALAVVAWAVFVVVWRPLLDRVRWSDLGPSPRVVFVESLRQASVTSLVLLVIFGVLLAAVGLVVSHGVAGPLVRLRRAVRTAAEEEDYNHRVRLRRGDCLVDFAEEINALLSRLEQRQREQRLLLGRVAEAVGAITSALERGEAVTQEVLEQTQELEGLLTRAAIKGA